MPYEYVVLTSTKMLEDFLVCSFAYNSSNDNVKCAHSEIVIGKRQT